MPPRVAGQQCCHQSEQQGWIGDRSAVALARVLRALAAVAIRNPAAEMCLAAVLAVVQESSGCGRGQGHSLLVLVVVAELVAVD